MRVQIPLRLLATKGLTAFSGRFFLPLSLSGCTHWKVGTVLRSLQLLRNPVCLFDRSVA